MQLGKKTSHRLWSESLGFSALEMMIVLTAIGIVVLVAVPGSTYLVDKYRMKVTSASIITGIELARSEASARSSAVVLCPSSNGNTCRNDSDWSFGWLVFSDGNGNGTVQDIELIKVFDAPSPTIRVMADGAVQNRATFTATGLTPDNNAQTGQFQICPQDSEKTATLVTVDADGWVQKIPTREFRCTTG